MPEEVLVTGLPLGLLDDSLRVSARGAVAAMASIVLDSPGEERSLAPRATAEIKAARRNKDAADLEVSRLRRELEAIEQAPLVAELPSRESPPEWAQATRARRELAALRLSRTRALRAAIVEAQAVAAERQRALSAVIEIDARASSARSPRALELRKAARVVLRPEPGAAGPVELVVEYAVRGARWVPSYVARFTDGAVELAMRASLMQRTGEDWSGVALELSTATLDRPSELPELAALRLGRRQQAPQRQYRPPPQGVAELFSDYQRDIATHTAPGASRRAKPTSPPMAMPAAELSSTLLESPEVDEDTITGVDLQRKRTPTSPGQGAVYGGAPPPPRRSAAPMPLSMPGPMGPPPAAAMAMTPAPVAPGQAPQFALEGGGGGPSRKAGSREARKQKPVVPEPAPALLALVAQLDYPGLMMAGPEHAQRGQLIAMSLLRRYQLPEQLGGASDGAELDTNTLHQRFAAAHQAATDVERAKLPAGATDRWSHDFDFAMTAEGRIDVPSDGGWHSILLSTRRAPARVLHVVVPREQPDVFRHATSQNPFDAPILPGPVDVYDGSRFLVTAQLAMVPPGGDFELSLGVDSTIKVARNVEYREEVAGMLRGGLRLVHDVRIDVQSHAPAQITLEVRERVPVPDDDQREDITVKVTAARPPWQPWTPRLETPQEQPLRGGYAWQISLGPRSSAQLAVSYEIAISGKHELVGGNRREP